MKKLNRLHRTDPKLRCFYKCSGFRREAEQTEGGKHTVRLKQPEAEQAEGAVGTGSPERTGRKEIRIGRETAAPGAGDDFRPVQVRESLQDWTGAQFLGGSALLFIGAAGIAVRAIAPFVKDKLADVPVLVMDDAGQYVIPILSGHVGGANDLARRIAEETGAVPVITTSTDVHQKFAVDLFAKENGLIIINREGIAAVSAKVLRGETVTVGLSGRMADERDSIAEQLDAAEGQIQLVRPEGAIDVWIGRPAEVRPQALLYLERRDHVLGIGCRRGKTAAELKAFVSAGLSELGLDWTDLCCMASIDVKKTEEGLRQLAAEQNLRFQTFSAEELLSVPGEFAESEFVRTQVGVGNVAERAAMAACRGQGELILPKRAENGMTMAVARCSQ